MTSDSLFNLEIVYGRDVVVWHVAGLLGAQILCQPPVGMALVDDNERIVLANGHVIRGCLFVVEQGDVVGLLVRGQLVALERYLLTSLVGLFVCGAIDR